MFRGLVIAVIAVMGVLLCVAAKLCVCLYRQENQVRTVINNFI